MGLLPNNKSSENVEMFEYHTCVPMASTVVIPRAALPGMESWLIQKDTHDTHTIKPLGTYADKMWNPIDLDKVTATYRHEYVPAKKGDLKLTRF